MCAIIFYDWMINDVCYVITLTFQEDDLDILPIGRLARDSAIFRKEGASGIIPRNIVMGKHSCS